VPAYSPASLDAVRSQPEVDTHDDEEGKGGGQCARPTNLAHCAESAAAHIRPVSGRQAELAPRLLDQGRNVAEYLAVLPSRDARVIASARSGKLCAGFTAGPED
jgi:hypothetical protein